jgi:hypothetical protein
MTSILKGVLKCDVFFGDLAIEVRLNADSSRRLWGWRSCGCRYLVGLGFMIGVL